MSEEFVEGYRLSPQQERLWYLSSAGDGPVYRSQCAAFIKGHLDSGRLQMAVGQVIARHEILRTDFHSAALSLPAQVISGSASATVEEIDIAALSEQEQETEIELLYEGSRLAEVKCPNGGALNVTLIRVRADRQILIVSAGSLWSDRQGLKNIIREVIGECQAEIRKDDQVAQYADVSEIFNKLLYSEKTKAGRDFWQSRASRNVGEVRLATERAPKGAFKPKVERRVAGDELSEGLKSLCKSIGAGERAVLLSVFGVMICRMNGERAVRVGVGYDGRTFEGLREAVGVYMRYLPVDIDVADDTAFSDLAKSVDESTHELSGWQNYFNWRPFFDPSGSGDESGYFMYLFEYEVEPREYSTGAIRYRIERSYACIDRFEVKLFCYRSGGVMSLELHYDSSLYDPAEINRLADHYLALLQDAVRSPRRSLGRLNILSAQQREMILNGFNRTRREYDTSRCLHELIEERAERIPEAIAAVCERRALSYKELNTRANQLANYLRGRGVGPEQFVGVMVSRGIEMVVGLLGALKAGAAYLPLDASYPNQRLACMLRDAEVAWLLTERQYTGSLPDHDATVIYLDTEWDLISRESESGPANLVTPWNLVYVIYTSGSTGNPKGAMLTHAGVINCLCWMQETYALDPTDRFLMKTSINFDPSVWELFWPLWIGGAVVLAEPQYQHDTGYLVQLITEREVTSAFFVPTMLRFFLDESGVEACRSLRRVICGGESLSTKTANYFLDKLQAEFHNAYGLTETSIAATDWTCRHDDERSMAPIGKPLGNTQIYILDTAMEPVPIGVPGEIYIGGLCVGRGYLNRPDLTAASFIPTPFSLQPGERLYRSGDTARHLTNGEIEYLGRIDQQVKLRGFRIELGEIEEALARFEGVRQAVVIAREDEPGRKRLIAYVMSEESIASSDLRSHLKERLPEYMAPAAFVIIDNLPLLPSGKVNRNMLPSPVNYGTGSDRLFAPPRTPIEEKLKEIWSEILRDPMIGIHDNFFDLGGHSMLISRLLAKINANLGFQLPVTSLFQAPTIAELAEIIDPSYHSDLECDELSMTDFAEKEVVLDPSICPKTQLDAFISDPENLFLTGATGFIGAFLLGELLAKTSADIYCLVRAASIEEGAKRLQLTLKNYMLWNDSYQDRIIPILGDLSQPLLGIEAVQFNRLASKIDVIYHSGAQVNFIYPYSALKAANVIGTQEVFRLACEERLKPVHHISTLSVFNGLSDSPIMEQAEPSVLPDLNDGYSLSKWVAERLVSIARDRGIPASIYRLGRVTGHSQTGVSSTSDLFFRMIRGCIGLGSVPDLYVEVNITPVDYVSRAIVHLSRQETSAGKNFHLRSIDSLEWKTLVSWIRSAGYHLEELAYNEWVDKLKQAVDTDSDNSLIPLLPIFGKMDTEIEDQEKEVNIIRPDHSLSMAVELALAGISCPIVHRNLANQYLDYFVRRGLLERP